MLAAASPDCVKHAEATASRSSSTGPARHLGSWQHVSHCKVTSSYKACCQFSVHAGILLAPPASSLGKNEVPQDLERGKKLLLKQEDHAPGGFDCTPKYMTSTQIGDEREGGGGGAHARCQSHSCPGRWAAPGWWFTAAGT